MMHGAGTSRTNRPHTAPAQHYTSTEEHQRAPRTTELQHRVQYAASLFASRRTGWSGADRSDQPNCQRCHARPTLANFTINSGHRPWIMSFNIGRNVT
ncbi:unnamed protein product [Euphydryas editha]|uniref:Uncharacterized protein n=1 Tax=Euphydryas editha TaxID=104508 RepID=A0AAU9V347_EUPED|nr:unnamed protein product [Euphydryas editha]